jgi:hypothetical protein
MPVQRVLIGSNDGLAAACDRVHSKLYMEAIGCQVAPMRPGQSIPRGPC